MELADGTVIVRAAGVPATVVDGQFVLLAPDQRFLALDATGEYLWQRLAAATTLDKLVDDAVRDFVADREVIRTDVIAFVLDLGNRGLLSW